MTLLIALGNIGDKYENTRHNAGFMLADLLLKGAQFSDVSSSKFKGSLYKKGSLLVLKPSTFMNASGESALVVREFYKPERIIVAHDDIDLKLGDLRFKLGGSSGGHNGIKSLDAMVGSEYERIRIGVGRGKYNVIDFVLGKFSAEELELLEPVLKQALSALDAALKGADIKELSAKYSLKAPKLETQKQE